MAGDWIKVRIDLVDDPDVFILSDLLSIESPTVVGHLVAFWSWLDRHTADGKEIKLSESMIDRRVGLPGFASSLRQIGWLSGENMALELPNYDRHNGSSAKARALESEAKRLRRNAKNEGLNNVGQMSDKKSLKCQTREEKRREELKKNIKKKAQPKKAKTSLPKDFSISDQVKAWAEKNNHQNLDKHLDSFVLKAKAKNYQYVDWDSAFMNAVRDDWAKLKNSSETNIPDFPL